MSGKPRGRKDLTFDEIAAGLADTAAGSQREIELLAELHRRQAIAQIEAANAQMESAIAQKASAMAQEANALAQKANAVAQAANAKAQRGNAVWLAAAGVGAGLSALLSLLVTIWPMIRPWLARLAH
jgi:hypothetical protein